MKNTFGPLSCRSVTGLHYVEADAAGWRRIAFRGKFRYLDAHGARITDAAALARIKALAIPPAYQDVWICADPRGHLQATGRDARRRKQYRYHAEWTRQRNSIKHERMIAFAEALPRIRRAVKRDLAETAITKTRVLASIVALLECTMVRVGNTEYARDNGSYGLTTLRRKHVRVLKSDIELCFRGKSGVEHRVRVTDSRVAKIVRRCMEIPGQSLFKYLDDTGVAHPIDSSDVNAYLKEVSGAEFTAKDYRTWHGSVLALEGFQAAMRDTRERKRIVPEVMKRVAARLSNTPAVCRKSYVHPRLVADFLDGKLCDASISVKRAGLRAAEQRLWAFLSAIGK